VRKRNIALALVEAARYRRLRDTGRAEEAEEAASTIDCLAGYWMWSCGRYVWRMPAAVTSAMESDGGAL